MRLKLIVPIVLIISVIESLYCWFSVMVALETANDSDFGLYVGFFIAFTILVIGVGSQLRRHISEMKWLR